MVGREGLEPRNAVARTRPIGRLAPQGALPTSSSGLGLALRIVFMRRLMFPPLAFGVGEIMIACWGPPTYP